MAGFLEGLGKEAAHAYFLRGMVRLQYAGVHGIDAKIRHRTFKELQEVNGDPMLERCAERIKHKWMLGLPTPVLIAVAWFGIDGRPYTPSN